MRPPFAVGLALAGLALAAGLAVAGAGFLGVIALLIGVIAYSNAGFLSGLAMRRRPK